MYCLDSNILIALLRGDRELNGKIRALDPGTIASTTIAMCELFKGAYKSVKSEEARKVVYDIARNYKILSLTMASAEIFGRDINVPDKRGMQTQVTDLMIASIAKANDLIIVTRNKKHFENIPDLKVEEW